MGFNVQRWALTLSVLKAFITVRNLQRSARVEVVDLKKFATNAVSQCLKLCKGQTIELTKLRAIFIWLISDRRMASLNRRFARHSGSTDVLTFQHGEIFISVEMAQRNARKFGNSLAGELRLCIVHGLLHLHGFDDQTEAEAREMERTQQKILHVLQ